MNVDEVMAEAQRMDLNRQRQVEAAKAVTNRLLEARESEDSDAELIANLIAERSGLQQHILELQAKLDNVGTVVANWDDVARDRIVDALAGR